MARSLYIVSTGHLRLHNSIGRPWFASPTPTASGGHGSRGEMAHTRSRQ